MERVKIIDKFFVKYISSEQITSSLEQVAGRINNDYKEQKPPVLLIIMTGGFIFAADLMRKLNMDCRVESITVSSYVGDQSSNKIKVVNGITGDLSGENVIVIDEIADSGLTLSEVKKIVSQMGAASVKSAVLIDKPHCHKVDTAVDYAAIVMNDDNFIVGYGLDYDGYGRGLKDIFIAE